MAEHTINGQPWPDGTAVGVYLATSQPDPRTAPAGAAVTTATVTAGRVTFTGLPEKVPFVAWAADTGRRFLIAPVPPASSDRARIERLEGLDSGGGGGGGGGGTIDPEVVGVIPSSSPYNADRTGTVDATNALRGADDAALDTNSFVTFLPGVYRVSGIAHDPLVKNVPRHWRAAVPGTVVIQRTVSTPIIDIAGSRSAPVALTANVAAGALTCTTATLPSGLAANDYVQLRCSTIFNGVAVTAEVLRVKSISGSGPYTITFYGRPEEAYTTAASAVIEKLNLVGPSTLDGIVFRQTAMNRDSAADALVQTSLTQGDQFSRCTARDADSPGFEPQDCIDWTYSDIVVDNLTDDLGNNRIGYGINAGGNCRDGWVLNLRGRFIRHAFTTNANIGASQGAPRHITVVNGHASETSSAAFDTHPEGKHITFQGCHVHHMGGGSDAAGIQTRAPFTTIADCTVVGCGTGAANIMIQTGARDSQIVGGELIQSGNSSAIQIVDNDCHVKGTKIRTVGTGYNATPILAAGQRATIRDVEIHQGDNTAATITFGGGSGHILEAGILRANSARNAVNVAAGVGLTVTRNPYRDPSHLGLPFAAGAGAGSIVYWDTPP